MKQTFKIVLFISVLALSNTVGAFNEHFGKSTGGKKPKPNPNEKANCAPANFRKSMRFNDASAQLETGGLLFLDRSNGLGTYKVPKTGTQTLIYAGALWMGGTDNNGQLKLAAVLYRNTGNDFWPGPLTTTPGTGNFNPLEIQGDSARRDFGDANIDPDQCLLYDNIFTIEKAQVVNFITWWECNNPNPFNPTFEGCDGVVQPNNEDLASIYAWPGNGDPTRFQDYYLAPFKDRDEDGVYDPDKGDYPWFDDILDRDDVVCGFDRRVTLFGDQSNWWVFNDKGNIHTETQGDPIGMEIRAQAFSFATNDEINKMTFYNYELINRGTQTLFDTYFSQYADVDLGNYIDDYVGCDVSRGLGYVYNADAIDETNGANIGFGSNPPAVGIDFFEGPYQDADGRDNLGPAEDSITGVLVTPSVADAIADNGIVYKGLGLGYSDNIIDNERYGMRNFTYFSGIGGSAGQSDPTTATHFYNYMRGLWQFGDQLFFGGTGFPGSPGVTTIETNYMFPNDSDPLDWATDGIDPGFNWSELTPTGPGSSSNPAGDRRFVQSAGPFTLRPGAVNNITVGIVYGRSVEGEILSSVNAVRSADTKAQALFDNCFDILEPPHAPLLTCVELGNELILSLENPITSNNYQEKHSVLDPNIVDPPDGSASFDKFYKFEGYQIFQMKSATSTVDDIDDPSNARLVAQCDKKNGITKLVNFEFDEALGFAIPTEKVVGEDKGVRHTFRVTEDLFASGSRTLVNNKTYYFIAVAYAHNNYKKYDPEDPLALDGQRTPYIRSNKNGRSQPILSTICVPHLSQPSFAGTVVNSVYGQTPRIRRLDGTGNGNNALELTKETEDSIVTFGSVKSPEYDFNGAPIQVKVVDPLNVVGGYFECKFRDYGTAAADIDTASWTVYRYDTKGGTLLDSVQSENTVILDNEQIVPDWGLSIKISQNKYFFGSKSFSAKDLITNPISASVEYSDSTKPWMTFIPDDASFSPRNWIRSGNYVPDQVTDCDPFVGPSYLSPCCYTDEVGKDSLLLFNKLLGGGVSPHKLVGYQCDFMPVAVPASALNSYSSAKSNSSISFMPSVDIVLTTDKSKWTRCIVVELGRDANLNQNGTASGKLRGASSVDKNGVPDGSGTTGMGWFPGYAIDLETGARLHMAFGENSFLGGENGSDMIWNPTSNILSSGNFPLLGGQHPIWVYGININNEGCPIYDGVNNWVYDQYQIATPGSYKKVFTSLVWIANSVLTQGENLLQTDARIKLRINKEFRNFTGTGANGGKPMYSWSMDDLKTTKNDSKAAASALDLINVVPNPYYAFSEYERNRVDSRVKITNLPDICTVTIYNVSGKLIRQFKKDNTITSLDWDLKNVIGVPISSGVYIIHVDVPGVGEKIVKFFGGMRQIDLESI